MHSVFNWLLSLQLYQVFEIIASFFGAFGLTFGLGTAALDNYRGGEYHFRPRFVAFVFVPTGLGQSLRAAALYTGPVQYWFFIGVDVVAFVITAILIAQYFGYLMKKPSA